MNRFQVRVGQGLRAIVPRVAPPQDTDELRVLDPGQLRAFRRLPAFDQHHLIAVRNRLLTEGPVTPDLEAAALLHDVAKGGTAAQPGRVRLFHRVAIVLLDRLPSQITEAIGKAPPSPWRAGFTLVVYHADLGADEAAHLGCSARTCWLIRHHHDAWPVNDPELRRLIVADDDASKAGVD